MKNKVENMDVCDVTVEEFLQLKRREWDEDIGGFDSLIILPRDTLHDSGYLCMDFVAVKDGKPLCRLSGCSDVLHIGGIGGSSHRCDWSIDCLPTSGLLRMFCHRKLRCGVALSSFEVFAIDKQLR